MVNGDQVERQNCKEFAADSTEFNRYVEENRRSGEEVKVSTRRVLPRGTARSIERLPRKQARALVAATFFGSMLSSSSVIN